MQHEPVAQALRPTTVGALRVLMTLTFAEAVGERVLTASFAVAVVSMGFILSCSELAIFAHERVLVDGALTAMTLTPLLLTMVCAQVLMERDMGARCASALMAQPISAGVWLLGRFLGLWLAMVAEVAVMGCVFAVGFVAAGVPLLGTRLCAMGLVPVECTLALAITMTARCMSQRHVAWITATVLVGAGYLTLTPAELRDQPWAVRMPAFQVAQALLPQMQRVNLRAAAARDASVEAEFVVSAVFYSVGYSGAALLAGAAALRRRRCL